QINLMNPEGTRVMHDIIKPLPLGGPPAYGISHWWFKRKDFTSQDTVPLLIEMQSYLTCGFLVLSVSRPSPSKLNHLSRADKVHLFNAVNLWIRNIVIRQRVEDLQLDYTIIHKTRAVIYKDMNNQKKMMRETKVHKLSGGTLTRILEKLDFMVKEYELFKFNPHMEHRIWSEDDKRRSQEFIKLI
nr:hypothetical protein [Tanacetum cinerariifolium]